MATQIRISILFKMESKIDHLFVCVSPILLMVKIDFVEIDGLYSYDFKTRIKFDDKNIIVGTNDSGKSSIFKAIDFFLQSLTRTTTQDKPWQPRQTHEMQIGLTLSYIEKQFLIEILGVIPIDKRHEMYRLIEHNYPAYLIDKFDHICIKIIWHDTPFTKHSSDMEFYLEIPEFGLTVHAKSHFPATIHSTPHPVSRNGISEKTFGSILEDSSNNPHFKIENFTKEFSMDEDMVILIYNFPPFKRFTSKSNDRSESNILNSADYNKLQSIGTMSGLRQDDNDSHSFFQMLGNMLKNRISLISESRNFQNIVTLDQSNFKNDGSNLQNFIFWLQNSGHEDDLEKLGTIKKGFKEIMQDDMTFDIQIISSELESDPEPRKRRIPDKATIKFHEPNSLVWLDFNTVGAGIRESLFLLSKCMGKDETILMDEPATNLHPIQIKSLMNKILKYKSQYADKSNQIIIITHSPVLASLEMMYNMNITRIQKTGGSSHAIQPSDEDRKWLKDNLGAFHLLKTDIFFTKGVVLVEGPSDRIFLETLLSHSETLGIVERDLLIVDVEGNKSFPKFKRLLKIFDIPYIILADSDGKDFSDQRDTQRIESIENDQSINHATNTFTISDNLECYLSALAPDIYSKLKTKYLKKPERAYHFINELLDNNMQDKLKSIICMLNHMSELIEPTVE